MSLCALVGGCPQRNTSEGSHRPGEAASDRGSGPRLVLQSGFEGSLRTLAFSPDGRLLASIGGGEGTTGAEALALWDTDTGHQLFSLPLGDHHWHHGLAFDPEGRQLALGAQGVVRIIDTGTGAIVNELVHGPDAWYWDEEGLAVAWRGPRALVSGGHQYLRAWKLPRGRERDSWTYADDPNMDGLRFLAFDADGSTLASAVSKGTSVDLWRMPGEHLGEVETGRLVAVDRDPRGRLIAVAAKDDELLLWDLEAETVRRLPHAGSIRGVGLSPGARWLVGLAETEEDFETEVRGWALDEDARLGWQFADRELGYGPVAVSADGERLATTSAYRGIALWDTQSQRRELMISTRTRSVDAATFSSDGNWLMFDVSGALQLRSLAPGRVSRVALWRRADNYALSPDSRYLATYTSISNVLELVDLRTGSARVFASDVQDMDGLRFSPDGRLLVMGGAQARLQLWEVESGALVGELPPDERLQGVSTQAVFTPDSRRLLVGMANYLFEIDIESWTVTAERVVVEADSNSMVDGIELDPHGRIAVSIWGEDSSLKLLEYPSLDELAELPEQGEPVFSPDGSVLITHERDLVKVWDGRSLELRAEHGRGGTFSYSPDGKFLLEARGGSVVIRDPDSWTELASFLVVGNSDWVVTTPEGLFDGTPDGWRAVLWRFSADLFHVASLEQFFAEFFHPGLLDEILAGERPRPTRDVSELDRRQPEIELSVPVGVGDRAIEAETVELEIRVNDGGAGARDLRLMRNGVLVRRWHGELDEAVYRVRLGLAEGSNRLSAYAFNDDDIKSADAELAIEHRGSLAVRRGVLTILVVGVNDYAEPGYDLTYAVPDATAFAAALDQAQAAVPRGYERIEVVQLLDGDGTRANILAALDRLAGGPAPSVEALSQLAPAGPDDGVVLYVASHGIATDERFALWPHDVEPDALETMITDTDLERAFEGIDAGALVLILDTCQSGRALDAEEVRLGPMNSRGLAQLAYEKGMYVLTAAQAHQQALEAARLGHGFLTYALIEGVQTGAADTFPKDGVIGIREWLDYAIERVPTLHGEMLGLAARGQYRVELSRERIENWEAQSPRAYVRREGGPSFVVATLGRD